MQCTTIPRAYIQDESTSVTADPLTFVNESSIAQSLPLRDNTIMTVCRVHDVVCSLSSRHCAKTSTTTVSREEKRVKIWRESVIRRNKYGPVIRTGVYPHMLIVVIGQFVTPGSTRRCVTAKLCTFWPWEANPSVEVRQT